MMMKLTGYFVLLILTSKSVGFDEEEIPESVQKRINFRRRFQSSESEADLMTSLLLEAKRHSLRDAIGTAPVNVESPVRIAIFNAGDFSAHLKLNYILSGQQVEDQIYSDIQSGQHRSLFVPTGATLVRVRVNQSDISRNKPIIDEEIDGFDDSSSYCYLLAHTKSHPVYGRCPSTYRDMLEAWGSSK